MSPRFAASMLVLGLSLAACHGSPPQPKSAQKGSSAKTPAVAKNQPATNDTQVAQSGDPATKSNRTEKTDARTAKADRAAARSLNDAQVLAMTIAFSNADLGYARIAASRARNAQVRAYASRLLADNASVNQFAMDLMTRTDLTIEDNETILDLREVSAQHRDQLSSVASANFDQAYILGELVYHESLLARIDHVLLPASRHPELKKMVTQFRPIVAAHLAQAEQLSQAMGAGNEQ
jgi:putative membrane protein